jgi:hypothetical protein
MNVFKIFVENRNKMQGKPRKGTHESEIRPFEGHLENKHDNDTILITRKNQNNKEDEVQIYQYSTEEKIILNGMRTTVQRLHFNEDRKSSFY